VLLDQRHQALEVLGRGHPGLVEDDRRARREPPGRPRASGASVLVEQLDQRGGRETGLAGEDVGRLA
jgi:hypothetical protein